MSDSVRDDIEAAMKGQEESTDENIINKNDVDDTSVDDTDAGSDKNDDEIVDEKGEKEPEKKEPEAKAVDKEEEQEGTWDHNKAPSSWSPKVRESWGSLPEDIRKEIIRREEDGVKGVRKLQEDFAPVRQFADHLSPFVQEANSMGVNPAQYIGNVMTAERSLRAGDPNARFEALLGIADQYGIPLRQYLSGSEGAQAGKVPQGQALPPEVLRELQEARQFRQQMMEQQQNQQTQSLNSQIEEFKQNNEFFEDVRDIMAGLVESGAAKGLKDAYEQAIWVHPEVRSVMLERDRSGKSKDEFNARRQAAASAAVKSSGAAELNVVDDDDDSVEALVRRSVAEQNRL